MERRALAGGAFRQQGVRLIAESRRVMQARLRPAGERK